MTDPAATPDAAADAKTEARDDRMPRGIPFIVANEFAERFCFYGINSILTIYMAGFLRYGQADATSYHSLWKSAAYAFPVVGAIVSDVFWGKFKTIITFSIVYATGCTILALVPGPVGLALGLFLVAFGTGGIKPCVSTNVGDQFTKKNQHLIERAFSYFYLAINAGSSISIWFCPVLLGKKPGDSFGPKVAFGMPAVMMILAVIVFWLGRNKFVHVPPAGKAWLREVLSSEGRRTIGRLSILYIFIACFWMLWDQSNGQTWTLQAESSLMDKNLGFGFTLLPGQVQVVNGLMILAMVPIFTFGIYPLLGKLFTVTPLRKIGIGLFVTSSSFLLIAWIESRIQGGHVVSAWWQILAYAILSAAEVMVSITGLEFSYKQAPPRMKSFVMALYLLAVTVGNLSTATVAQAMVKPLHAVGVETGAETWVELDDVAGFVTGQKIDFKGTGIDILESDGKPRVIEGEPQTLQGTYLVAEIDGEGRRLRLMDYSERKPVVSRGQLAADKAKVSTYKLVGPEYFTFFARIMAAMGVLFIFVAKFYREKTHVRDEA